MKYEDILKWRQDVYEQTVLAAQMVPRSDFGYGTSASTSISPAKPALQAKESTGNVQKALPKEPTNRGESILS